MDYRKIDSFLEKFKSLLAGSILEKGMIIEAIRKSSGVTVPESSLKIRGTTLYIGVSGTLKTAIHLKKEEILTTINSSRKRALTDIR